MRWVVNLILEQYEKIEDRVLKIVEYLTTNFDVSSIEILDIDATGNLGATYTDIINERGSFFISKENLVDLFKEDGQLIEFEAKLVFGKNFCSIIILDGNIVDILGDFARLPNQIIGSFV